MKVLVAMDSYKESLSAVDCCAAVAEGLQKADPKTEVIRIPLSDRSDRARSDGRCGAVC